MDNQSLNYNSIKEGVGVCRYAPIEIRFMALINAKCEAPYDWYKDLGIDRSDASKIRRGLLIPQEWLRIKIAHYFETDSSTIWKVQDLPHIKQLLKKQNKTKKEPEQKQNSGLTSEKINECDKNGK